MTLVSTTPHLHETLININNHNNLAMSQDQLALVSPEQLQMKL